jgi:hypothetical protein
MPNPMTLYHSISHPYGPNKQCLMDEMPIFNVHGSQIELIIRMLVVKTWTAFAQTPTKIHETDLLRDPTNVPLPQCFPSIWTQQTMFDDG